MQRGKPLGILPLDLELVRPKEHLSRWINVFLALCFPLQARATALPEAWRMMAMGSSVSSSLYWRIWGRDRLQYHAKRSG
jgi:hypothetical protein